MVGKRLFVFVAVMACVVGFGRLAMAQTSAQAADHAGGLGGAYGASGSQASTGPGTSTAATDDGQSLYSIGVPHDAPIPKDALRLRIIANSDSDADQALKRAVRDEVVVQVAKLVQGAQNATEARQRVIQAIPALQQTALAVADKHGYHYSVKTDVGSVPFPTKVYGNQVYPAGNYEALRITLGAGQGQNWWCVLFPPLCFVDIADGDAVPNTGGFPDLPPLETIQVPDANGQPTQVQVRLASADYGEELWKSVSHWFH
jgi:stage II sporulation protein R